MVHSASPHPRPQLERAGFLLLDGEWDFAFDRELQFSTPEQVSWERKIQVPFAPETSASGIGDTSFCRGCWYRRTVPVADRSRNTHLLLHFGAVDYHAKVWVNNCLVTSHRGGYTPFFADITEAIADKTATIVVLAEDDPHDLAKPRGKQDWQLNPHSIWYPRTTGIWQSVWLEFVPASWIGSLRWTPSLDRWEIGLEARIEGQRPAGMKLRVRLQVGDVKLAEDEYAILTNEVHRRIALSDPGIDDYRNELLWSPATPTLIQAALQLVDSQGEVIDSISSYTALRSIGIQGDRFVLNGRPYPLRMVLDQGYWPESGLTAPCDAALRHDIELTKAMGFNGARKHQKIESPRYLYWADALGLLVWEEMPSAYRFSKRSIEQLTREWMEVLERDVSHPCIIAWVPFNESWGVPDLPDSPAQRHYVQALYHLTRTLDPTRPVIGNDGWESVATDIIGIHDYEADPQRLAHRYGAYEALPGLFQRERPGGRLLILDANSHPSQPVMLTEFGGIACARDVSSTWGYSRADDPAMFSTRYRALLQVVHELPVLAGFCYTQFTDTYQEANGLLFADRTPKIPLEEIAAATRGPGAHRDLQQEFEWRERLMKVQRDLYALPTEDRHMQEDR